MSVIIKYFQKYVTHLFAISGIADKYRTALTVYHETVEQCLLRDSAVLSGE